MWSHHPAGVRGITPLSVLGNCSFWSWIVLAEVLGSSLGSLVSKHDNQLECEMLSHMWYSCNMFSDSVWYLDVFDMFVVCLFLTNVQVSKIVHDQVWDCDCKACIITPLESWGTRFWGFKMGVILQPDRTESYFKWQTVKQSMVLKFRFL